MRKLSRGLVFTLILVLGCTANLMLRDVRVDRSIREVKTGKRAVVSSVNYWSGNQGTFGRGDENKLAEMKESIATIIYNSGLFEDVKYTEGDVRGIKKERGKQLLYLDVMIYTTEIGSFNWWVTWPAIYPLPGYWPLQRKKGTVSVNIEVTVSDDERILGTINSYGADEYVITFYGFYRTSIVERSAEKAFMEAGSLLKTNLTRIDSFIRDGKNAVAKVLVGEIRDLKGADEIVVKHVGNHQLRMGELIVADLEGSRVKMIVGFPMMNISKCRLVKSAEYSRLRKKMNVYRN